MLNNTWLLETEFGWTGICAEPNPDYLDALRRNRRCIVTDACVGGQTGAEVDFVLAGVYGGIADFADADKHAGKRAPYRTAGRMVRLRTVSLDDLLRRHGAPREIDYLSIDTEGSEYEILRTFPFDRWRIRLITVEHNFTPQREDIRSLLEGHGYRRTEARWDDWYELSGT
jgi:FkbM family methyltransferase